MGLESAQHAESLFSDGPVTPIAVLVPKIEWRRRTEPMAETRTAADTAAKIVQSIIPEVEHRGMTPYAVIDESELRTAAEKIEASLATARSEALAVEDGDGR